MKILLAIDLKLLLGEVKDYGEPAQKQLTVCEALILRISICQVTKTCIGTEFVS